ncbi:MAG: hypothetical protein J5562_08650 [Clostridia bacterium]|nr:hypothetical protein [Clostridia bacterium]
MKRKIPFFPILGCISGMASVIAGFVLGQSVKNISLEIAEKGISPENGIGGEGLFDFVSQVLTTVFQSLTTIEQTVEKNTQMVAKLVDVCGKGFGLLLIFFGLFMICLFGSKTEKSLRAPARGIPGTPAITGINDSSVPACEPQFNSAAPSPAQNFNPPAPSPAPEDSVFSQTENPGEQ